MILPEDSIIKLNSLSGKSNFEKMIGTVGILTHLLGEAQRPIIVGGLAVEIYTRNEYTTVDIDLILSYRDKADEILTQLGFKKQGRHWFHPTLLVSVEIPNFVLEDADSARVLELILPDGMKVYVIGLEDIILDRLRACVHWKSNSDCEWAARLYYLHKDTLDIEYMKVTAKQDKTLEELEKIFLI
jgi:predicted nucleotidyltransferase